MVKGVTRRVIVVKSPDRRLFEQAIFIVREEAFAAQGVTARQVLEEAQRVADGYIRRNTGPGRWFRKNSRPGLRAGRGGCSHAGLGRWHCSCKKRGEGRHPSLFTGRNRRKNGRRLKEMRRFAAK